MQRVVDSGAVIHDVFGSIFYNSAFYSNDAYWAPYFVQAVSSGGWSLLRRPVRRRAIRVDG